MTESVQTKLRRLIDTYPFQGASKEIYVGLEAVLAAHPELEVVGLPGYEVTYIYPTPPPPETLPVSATTLAFPKN